MPFPRGEGRRVPAVVHEDGGDPSGHVSALSGVAQVVVEPMDGALGRGFAVAGYPVFALVDAAGTVTAAGFDPKTLSARVRTAA
ncbi:hypothetical protein [Embleya sp. AB8]|uniref:hypothetical protein n=1 Tax=Embleya sp. AB8 TaxID=3156304 RepID=UPI003C7589B7